MSDKNNAADVTPERVAELREIVQGRGDWSWATMIDVLDTIDALRAELAALKEIEASDDVRGFLTAHGNDGTLLVCGEFSSGREFQHKFRLRKERRVEVPEPSDLEPVDYRIIWHEVGITYHAHFDATQDTAKRIANLAYKLGQHRARLSPPATPVDPWIRVEDRLPEDGQVVGFVTKCERDPFYHGRVLGGRYNAGEFGGFSVPGLMVEASHWFPFPAAPTTEEKEAERG